MTVEEMQAKMKFDNTSQINPFFKEAVGMLKINNSLRIAVYDKLPCRFHRWMAKLLLGWEYKESEEKTNERSDKPTDCD